MTREQILLIYKKRKSITRTSKETGLSIGTIRKIVFDEGLFSTPTSQLIRNLYEQGLSVKEIMQETGLSRSAVHVYLPYSKGLYNSENPTQNALNVRECRKKKRNNKF